VNRLPQTVCRIVEIAIFKFADDKPKYLLLHRAKDEKIHPGIWQLVTGTVEKNEKAVEAALRELKEETGLNFTHFWVVSYVNSFYDPEHDEVNFLPVFAAQVEDGIEPRLSAEHSEHRWFSYEEALKKLVWPGQRAGLKVVHDYIVSGEEASRRLEMKLDPSSPNPDN
jgi:dATP pyrophosphohydrolase